MLRSLLVWLGFANPAHDHRQESHGRFPEGKAGHVHTHGVVDPSITTTESGLWAVKWSFVILAITAALQFVVVMLSGSVALLADMIHNIGDAVTAIPLGIAGKTATVRALPPAGGELLPRIVGKTATL